MTNIYDGIVDTFYGDIFEDIELFGWTPEYDYDDSKRLLIEFLNKYGYSYEQSDLDFIKRTFLSLMGIKSPDVRLSQIYSHLGFFNRDEDPYLGYLNKFEEHFNVDSNILDIASGCFPSWANKIAKKQIEIGSGRITLYDPKLVIDRPLTKNMTIHKEAFTKSVNIKSYDVITSILPCEATRLVINSSLKNKKDFFVALCGCHVSSKLDSIHFTHDEIINQVYRDIKESNLGSLEVDSLGTKYNNHLPILIYKNKA